MGSGDGSTVDRLLREATGGVLRDSASVMACDPGRSLSHVGINSEEGKEIVALAASDAYEVDLAIKTNTHITVVYRKRSDDAGSGADATFHSAVGSPPRDFAPSSASPPPSDDQFAFPSRPSTPMWSSTPLWKSFLGRSLALPSPANRRRPRSVNLSCSSVGSEYRVEYSRSEVETIYRGVEYYGQNSWRSIWLAHVEQFHPSRDPVKLYNKWRKDLCNYSSSSEYFARKDGRKRCQNEVGNGSMRL